MNVLFLSLANFDTLHTHGIYADLLMEFVHKGHKVYVISPIERRYKEKEHVIYEDSVKIVKVKIFNMQKTNTLEKGISMLTIERMFIQGIKRELSDVKFDLVLYPTPPITIEKVVRYVRKRDCAKTYLLLKDIFPQNAVDINLMRKDGLLYRYFRKKETLLYKISDRIGCMSKANVEYVMEHNLDIDCEKIEICPNSILVQDVQTDEEERNNIREKYGIPNNQKVFVYGGNLGKPQDIPFIMKCLEECRGLDCFFLIIGDGTDYSMLERYCNSVPKSNVMLMKKIPKEEYDTMIRSCDVGLVFLDHRFTIPNFPSRLLGYMQAKLPVLAVTDPNSDVGRVITRGEFGWWCKSDDAGKVKKCINDIINLDTRPLGQNAFEYLKKNYSVDMAYKTIVKGVK